MKYHGKLEIAACFASLLANKIKLNNQSLPEIIIPMPLFPARQRQRGYNQAVELARISSQILGIKLANHCCKRVLNTPPQSQLPAKQRYTNIKGVFQWQQQLLPYQHIAILDDVVTTMSSVTELIRSGLQNPNKRAKSTAAIAATTKIDVYCIARSL